LGARARGARRFAAALALALLAAPPGAVHARAYNTPFRCGSKIIYIGMMRAEVLNYCGAPTSESTEMREVRTDNNRVLGTTEINRWIYQTGSTVRILVFLDQKLQSIERLY
jgi:hypothetical protein